MKEPNILIYFLFLPITQSWRLTNTPALQTNTLAPPTLFNLYTNDLPVTGSRKFIYADDICLTKQAQRSAVNESD